VYVAKFRPREPAHSASQITCLNTTYPICDKVQDVAARHNSVVRRGQLGYAPVAGSDMANVKYGTDSIRAAMLGR
jgi:hypothetical protein